jgi:hypothetical protein
VGSGTRNSRTGTTSRRKPGFIGSRSARRAAAGTAGRKSSGRSSSAGRKSGAGRKGGGAPGRGGVGKKSGIGRLFSGGSGRKNSGGGGKKNNSNGGKKSGSSAKGKHGLLDRLKSKWGEEKAGREGANRALDLAAMAKRDQAKQDADMWRQQREEILANQRKPSEQPDSPPPRPDERTQEETRRGETQTAASTAGGNSMANDLTQLAEQYHQAVSKMSLESLKEIHGRIEDLAGAEALFAQARGVIAKRLGEETPVDGAITEQIAKQSNVGRQTAAVFASTAGAMKKRHAADWERFDTPRTEEHKADYRANKD